MSNFSKRLRSLRKGRGYTQETFASAIGVQSRRYAHWEQGTYEPPLDVLVKICIRLETTSDYLLCITDDPKHEQTPGKVLEEIKKLISQ